MMSLPELPSEVTELIRSATIAEFATTSAAGVPIDTPALCFPPETLDSIDVATGLAYPAKAERARRNPKVGLLIEGCAGEPVISIAGLAVVRDRDIQANALRYIAETASGGAVNVPWSVARQAVWYWARIIISVIPQRLLWWPDAAAMDGPPNVWRAPQQTNTPASDAAPAGAGSAPPDWPQPSWPELAEEAFASGLPAHLTLLDAEGFPLPFRASDIVRIAGGFRLRAPAGAPWARGGKATLSFGGRATFVGDVSEVEGLLRLTVERTLPILPLVADRPQLWAPSETTRRALMGRLTHELSRRGQKVPDIPQEQPRPTAGAERRMARLAALSGR